VVTNIVNELSKAAKAIGARRLAIDPVAPLVTTSTSEIAWVREYIRSLIFNIEDKIGTTTLITSEIPTGDDSLSRYGVEEFLASGIIVLGLVREGGKITRTLFIRKMRWTAVDPTIYTFVIQRGKGINITGVLS
jgi:circadian clock protein KaiC